MANDEIAGELGDWPALAANAAGQRSPQARTDTARCVGGPLDGRDHPVRAPEEGQLLTHTHLHAGPKIQSFYVLGKDDAGDWAFYFTAVDGRD